MCYEAILDLTTCLHRIVQTYICDFNKFPS